ncbi:DUF2510 domain-containing protein, partial [Escherichia coli]|uniref:DUF2510 domain-containing protein n=1 Tax=Escherichia coli TaxID=562 RepID=UPI002B24D3FC
MTDTAPPAASIPAGWYADPGNVASQRWWDGTQWTDHVAPGPTGVAAYGSPQAAAQLKAPEGTSWNTPWIWLVLGLPMLGLVPLFTTDFSTSTSIGYSTNPLANGTDPIAALINFAVSLIITGAVVA